MFGVRWCDIDDLPYRVWLVMRRTAEEAVKEANRGEP